MDNVMTPSLYFLLIFASINPGSAYSVRIQMKTLKMDGRVLKAANITCLCDDMGSRISEIVSLQLLGPGSKMVVSLRADSTVSVADDAYLSKVEVTGQISKDVGRSVLSVTMTDVLSAQSGFYTCHVFFFNHAGFMEHDEAGNILDTGKQDVDKVILFLMSRIKDIEEENQKKEKELDRLNEKVELQVTNRLERLEDQTDNQTTMMTAMDQRASYMSAFSAGYLTSDKLVKGQVLVFRKVYMKVGDGYDETKGIFTAPVDGYYVFHLVVFYYDSSANDLAVNIVANGKPVAQAYADNPSRYKQPSVSVVVRLQAGHVVKPVVKYVYGYNTLHSDPLRSEFTGYLIKPV